MASTLVVTLIGHYAGYVLFTAVVVGLLQEYPAYETDVNRLYHNEGEEHLVVSAADAVVDPGAVMVVGVDAMAAQITMPAPRLPQYLAIKTEKRRIKALQQLDEVIIIDPSQYLLRRLTQVLILHSTKSINHLILEIRESLLVPIHVLVWFDESWIKQAQSQVEDHGEHEENACRL